MRNTCQMFVCLGLLYLLCGCTQETGETTGEQLAKTYCASCHVLPAPTLLDKSTWKNSVLPVMGKKLGIKYYNGEAYADVVINRQTGSVEQQSQTISITDWAKICDYYKTIAPDTLPVQNRAPIKQFTNRFKAQEVKIDRGFPSATFVKIDPGNNCIYAANATDSSLTTYDKNLRKLSDLDVHGVVVDMNFENNLSVAGDRNGCYTNIGYINPNDKRTGNAYNFAITKQGAITPVTKIADSLPRPVQVTQYDIDKDGRPDYLICGFGNTTGELYWLRNTGSGYEKKVIWAIPGAIKAYIDDYNHDGLPDIMVLFAQAEEGIYLFTNTGNGNFKRKDILRFPPVYGSCYFELDDFNNDGNPDILYSCGDNADYSADQLKNYHGVYLYLNDGHFNFTQAFFFPMHGCYKAIARDFDKDGDLDIASISFFPDKKNQPQESFVYLENEGRFAFKPFAIQQYSKGNWLTMDAGDIDGDGFDDIVIGNLDMPKIRSNSRDQQLNKTAFLLLKNIGASK
ncbi:MAG TPA: VCBS repeat-containing protein [Chitinophagaceae bacterium]|nr:VCBS repeat-containing protein [Chitinophagaceae bacterium]